MIEFPSDICLTQRGYTGTAEHATEYLGIDKSLTLNPHVKLTGVGRTDEAIDNFFVWWVEQSKSGAEPFELHTTLFDKEKLYTLRFISKVTHTNVKGVSSISFNAEVLFYNDFNNTKPVAMGNHYDIEMNSVENFIKLRGLDDDGDFLTYKIDVPPANGTLKGVPPNLTYTPLTGFENDDCFSFTVSDKYGVSTPAVIELAVGAQIVPTTRIKYKGSANQIPNQTIPTKLYITGNVWYLDQTDTWVKKTKSYVPLSTNLEVIVASYDSVVDSRSDGSIYSITLLEWGSRKNIDKLFNTHDYMKYTRIIMGVSAGVCEATSARDLFNPNTRKLPLFDTGKIRNFDRFLKDTNATTIPDYDYSEGLVFKQAFMGAAIAKYPIINSTKGEIFESMFEDATASCLSGIDTDNTHMLSTIDMFKGTSFTNPDAAAITAITNGTNWLKATPCSIVATAITETQLSTDDKPTIDGSVTSIGKYYATYDTNTSAGTVNYAWVVVGGTIVNGTVNSATVEVETDTAASGTLSVSCIVSDNNSSASIGDVLFNVVRGSAFIDVVLPLHSGIRNLRTYIDSINSGWVGDVRITNNTTLPPVTTGDLGKYSRVQFINNGEIQAYSRADGLLYNNEKTAFNASTSVELINNGWIRGCGGRGGRGGVGKNDTYSAYEYVTFYTPDCHTSDAGVYQVLTISHNNQGNMSWNGHSTGWVNNLGTSAGWHTIAGLSGHYRRKAYVKTAYCSHSTKFYQIEQRRTVQRTRIGGAGGYGGRGRGYGFTNVVGVVGSPSSPTGGNSGGRGGWGQTWGLVGNAGWRGGGQPNANGVWGIAGGKSISGVSNITMTKQGHINGATQLTKAY